MEDQSQFLEQSFKNLLEGLVAYIPNTFKGTTIYLSMVLLFLLSVFFFLYYSAFFMTFIFKLSGKEYKAQVKTTAEKIKNSVKNYIVGLFIVILIVAMLNSVGLLILGIEHAVFFGILGSILTIIPYIGILIGSLLPALFAYSTKGSILYPFIVILIFSFVQFLEGNFITPNIIGSKENINPYAAILGLFAGGMLLGKVGIIFAIPILGIIKIICDDIDSLKAIGFVLGNQENHFKALQSWFSKIFHRRER